MFSVFVKLFALSLVVFQIACTRAVDATNEILIDASGFNNKLTNTSNEAPVLTLFNAHFKGKVVVDERRCPIMGNRDFPATECPNYLFGKPVDFGGLEFPSGEKIVIQVVIATMDSAGNINFYFKGKEVVLDSGENTLVFNTSEFNIIEGSSAQGNVIGYVPDRNNISGRLVGGFKPDPNQPEFRIFSSVFAGGHFNIFMPAGVKMTFKVLDPKDSNVTRMVLFENQSLDEIIDSIDTASVSAIAVGLPRRFRWNSGDSDGEFDPEEKVAIGFFNAEGGRLLAKNDGNYLLNFNATSSLFDEYKEGKNQYYYCDDYSSINNPSDVVSSGSLLSGTPNCSQFLNFDPAAGVVSNSTATIIKGSATASGCSPVSGETFGLYQASKYCYNIDITHLGGESSFTNGFFQELPSIPANDGFVDVNIDNTANEMLITYGMLPGMANVVSGTVSFLLDESQEGLVQDHINGGVNCTELALGSGVPNVGIYDVKIYDPVPAFRTVQADFGLRKTVRFPIEASIPNPIVAICPYFKSNDQVFFTNNGIISRVYNFFGTSGGSSASPATKLSLKPPFPVGGVEESTCLALRLQSVDNSGNLAQFSEAGSFALTVDNGALFDDSSCGTALSAGAVSAGEVIDQWVYYSGSGNAGASVNFGATFSSNFAGFIVDSVSGITLSFDTDSPQNIITNFDASNIYAGLCTSFELGAVNSAGELANSSTVYSIIPTVSGSGSVTFHDSLGDCIADSAISSLDISGSGGDDVRSFFVKAADPTNSFTIDFTEPANSTVTSFGTHTGKPAPAVHGVEMTVLGINNTESDYYTGLCQKIEVEYYDSNYRHTLSDGNVINLNVPPNVRIFDNSSCTSQVNSVGASIGNLEDTLYYKIDSIADFGFSSSSGHEVHGGNLLGSSINQTYFGIIPGYDTISTASTCDPSNPIKIGYLDMAGGLISSYVSTGRSINFSIGDFSGPFTGETFDLGSCASGTDVTSGYSGSTSSALYLEIYMSPLSTAPVGSFTLPITIISEPGILPSSSNTVYLTY
ncbi:MAG: hypothetical protein VX642_09185 [Bdellovibrionota bacterium]|nr:hypothetical protein [Bdellovibrionota bacterium]